MKRSHCLLVLLMVCLTTLGSPNFYTARLQAMASHLSLAGIDTLAAGEYAGRFFHQSHSLTVRINCWKEVEHIGLSLFNKDMKLLAPSPIYDFLERYLLELSLLQGTEGAIRLGLDNVVFEKGNVYTAFTLNGSEEFRQYYQSFRNYRVEWLREKQVILALSFDMDYQLLSGCDATELEELFLRKIKRFDSPLHHTVVLSNAALGSENYYVEKGTTFIIDAIRNDLYFHKKGSQWKLISNGKKPYQSIANTMLSSETEGDYDLNITLDMYGYKEQKFSVKLVNWLGLCREEGCTAYWGMKEKMDSLYTGTVFMVNDNAGYVHMLSIKFPKSTLANQKGSIEGRLYVYIPLHNVTENFFNNVDYKKMNDENKEN